MSQSRRTSRLILAVAGAGVLGAVVAVGLISALHHVHQPAPDLHTLLHDRVPLDAAEEGRLDAKEKVFADRRNAIELRLRAANARLATAIQRDPRWSPDVEAATKEVEAAAAELQRATLEHIFEMRGGLDPEHQAAYDKALIDALKQGAR